MTTSTTDVLIVGAGPTGLVLALWLSKLGVKVRIIDKAIQAATSTRALAVQARTLELYAQFDPELANKVIEDGHKVAGFNGWVKGSRSFRVPITRFGEGMTPFPFVKIYPQHEHEHMLTERLRKDFGISVELQTELVGFKDDCDTKRIVASLKKTTGEEETAVAQYIAGCDGSHSVVRKSLGISFPGGIYDQMFYVADIEGDGPPMDGELHVCLDQADFLAIFPLAGKGRARLIGTVRQSRTSSVEPRELSFKDVRGLAIEHMKLQVAKVNWFSTYRVHHRVADHFRKGRAFILGDAAHVHSPAGGQGMNTGIGDAINLAWKIAAVLAGDAQDNLLDTFEEERAHFAKQLVATTDRAFTLATAEGWFATMIRTRIVPFIAPFLLSFRAMRRFVFRTVSQISLHYTGMTLSSGRVGTVKGGQRLPWVEVDGASNFESLSSMRWQIHVYGNVTEVLVAWCKKHDIPLTEFEWKSDCASVGLTQDAVYVLRPDGHVALVQKSVDVDAIERYFADRQIRLVTL
ncbi:PheA/TfdB family FAD-binding monooxygenase [Pochonia chlamydosporia 170]|uniref:PheA/TfdB family FAD-binding monooxygenase n=1 Tax=Pochonia chlamydosporia 170 TaxID=1380566 RepID=A0A179F1P9_METCM|nr:PheA/TfdB family FAD-binding monooxygenase [Pochonia chlamydosporia 170]OAQ59404.1 PheA/TfdB family FAD-binding monooxygenase [Pochonia chlamydosporia 170]